MFDNFKSLSCKVPGFSSDEDGEKITYFISARTGSMRYAGTDANVYIRITGAGGDETSRAKLDNTFRDDFERGRVDKFKVKLEDVGTPALFTIDYDMSGLFADWYSVSFTVQKAQDDKVYHFPVHSWVEGKVVVSSIEAYLPQDDTNPIMRNFRKTELTKRQNLYKWRNKEDFKAKGLPGYIQGENHDEIPRDLQFFAGAHHMFQETPSRRSSAFKALLFDKFREIVDKCEQIDDFGGIMTNIKAATASPENHESWLVDKEFGRQMLNGSNAVMIEQCRALPANFPVTNEMVKEQMPDGKTLMEEMANGNIFIINCNIIEPISTANSCTPICLFHKNEDDLLPIAIQLHQDPRPTNPIWTPLDSEFDWITAKLHFRNMESNIHQLVTHVLHTHLVLEPFTVALLRCLSSRHPLYKLLYPHLRTVSAANTVARANLLDEDMKLSKLLTLGNGKHIEAMQAAFKKFHFSKLNYAYEMERKNTSSLKNYFFRDDANKMWQCTSKFVHGIIKLYYQSNEAVSEDTELQNFIHEAGEEGFAWEDGDRKGVPTNISTIEQLCEISTCLIFTATCQHSAVTLGQLDTYMMVPNAPMLLRKPPPTEKGKTSLETVTSTLPDNTTSCLQVQLAHALCKLSNEDEYLVNYSAELFPDDRVGSYLEEFKEEMKRISSDMFQRNCNLKHPYNYIVPERITKGITL